MDWKSRYVAHQPDMLGMVHYSDNEQNVWKMLFERQMKIIPGRACDEYMAGLECLNLSAKNIPQLPEISECLYAKTRWRVTAVPSLISARAFFELLAVRQFPAATFIRAEEELDYIKEPDIFHETFGHCPMLINPVFADFLHEYACKVLSLPEFDWPLLQRLFWFTIEFGLINTCKGLRIYGGGILSSNSETIFSLESDLAMRVLFDSITAFRTPYRIDKLQPIYFVINNYQQLYDTVQDLQCLIQRAHRLGEYPPFFTVDVGDSNIHINACKSPGDKITEKSKKESTNVAY